MKDAVLKLDVEYAGTALKARLSVSHESQETVVLESTIQRESLSGNVALACHGLNPPANKNRDGRVIDHARFWFSDWRVHGDKMVVYKSRCGLRLGLESLDCLLAIRQAQPFQPFRLDYLERHDTIRALLPSAINNPHASSADHVNDFVISDHLPDRRKIRGLSGFYVCVSRRWTRKR